MLLKLPNPHFLLALSLVGTIAPSLLPAAPAESTTPGTLAVHPSFPACFQGPDGQPLLLIGDYTWGIFSAVNYDYEAMLDTLQDHGLNFARVWVWWGHETESGQPLNWAPYQRTGPGVAADGRPNYDLTQFNPAFFERLRGLCVAARERGIFLQLILFDAWMLKVPNLWQNHAYHRNNNVNGVDGDPRKTGRGIDGEQGFCSLANAPVLAAQREYVRRVVDAVNEFDHIFFEVANENFYNAAWELQLSDFIRDYERTKPRRHLVMPGDLLNHQSVVQTWNPVAIHQALLAKRERREPLIFDTDFTINPHDDEVRRAMWSAVLSGGHFNYMDDSFQTGAEHHGDYRGLRRAALHRQIGGLAAFMRMTRFWEMQPADARVRSGNAFVMASTKEMVAYLPDGGRFTLDLSDRPGAWEAHWFHPATSSWSEKSTLSGGDLVELTAPSTADAALYLRVDGSTFAYIPGAPSQPSGTAVRPSAVRLSWAMIPGAAGYRVLRDGAEVATTVLPSYTDYGVAPATSHTYAVAAFELSDRSSGPASASIQVITPQRTLSSQVRLGATNLAERLALVTNDDGDTRAINFGGRTGREPATPRDPYFYFAVDDDWLFNESGLGCRLEVTYFDEAGFIEPQFDSVTESYTPSERITLGGSGEWKTAAWELRGCRFAGRQNVGADFRLFVGTHPVKISSVKLTTEPLSN